MYVAGDAVKGPRASRETLQRQEVLVVLQSSDRFRTAQEIHAELQNAGARVGLTTVYRHLQLLVDQGRVHAVQAGDRSIAYRWCSKGHHHHLVCRRCGAGVEVAAEEFESWVASAVDERGFSDATHVLEIFGICPTCSGRGRAS
jgi:Fur family ferric uptake transcriptional regulator